MGRGQATTIKGQNTFASRPTLCFAKVSCGRWPKHAWLKLQVIEIKSKCVWSDCVQCIPFILRRSPNEGGYMSTVYA